jgi:hypothetical protein
MQLPEGLEYVFVGALDSSPLKRDSQRLRLQLHHREAMKNVGLHIFKAEKIRDFMSLLEHFL